MLDIPPWQTRIFLLTTVANGNQPNISSKSFSSFGEWPPYFEITSLTKPYLQEKKNRKQKFYIQLSLNN